ncbi:adenylosuccinate lyase, partial [bacterium]|nr:adenylosuccinate lyase [bacterium]
RGLLVMLYKKNFIFCENITGLGRLVKGYVTQAFENIALWHERDISHSSVERVILPDATIVLDFLLIRLQRVLSGLVVNVDRMKENLDMLHGLIFSQKVLLALTGKGVSRDPAYSMVQRNALKTWTDKSSFMDNLLRDTEVTNVVTKDELTKLFDLKTYTQHVDAVFKRVGLTC